MNARPMSGARSREARFLAGRYDHEDRRLTGRPGTGRSRNRKPRFLNRPTLRRKARDRPKEPEPKATVPQQADASQEGQGGRPETDASRKAGPTGTESHGPSTGRRLAGRPGTGRTGDPSHGPPTGRRLAGRPGTGRNRRRKPRSPNRPTPRRKAGDRRNRRRKPRSPNRPTLRRKARDRPSWKRTPTVTVSGK